MCLTRCFLPWLSTQCWLQCVSFTRKPSSRRRVTESNSFLASPRTTPSSSSGVTQKHQPAVEWDGNLSHRHTSQPWSGTGIYQTDTSASRGVGTCHTDTPASRGVGTCHTDTPADRGRNGNIVDLVASTQTCRSGNHRFKLATVWDWKINSQICLH